ncbi:opacity family porin [Haemophilus influenzae]|uniref:opacity family porin n=1 Tax=Haemophilus influenzae TaxID=727 RepID=UPI001230E73C|nr:opacity family porin [Haemophilus influenzae]QEQ64146.1 outer membrane beta-barrel protein [Haemophilus influenzae biotype aegyptius]
MRNLLFSSLLFSSLLFSSAVQAKEDNGKGIYVQADWVHAREKIETHNPNQPEILQDYSYIKTHSNHPRFSIGYDFGNWRIAADYAHYRKWNHGKRLIIGPIEKDLTGNKIKSSTVIDHKDAGSFQATNSYGVSVIYDFDTEYKIKPYVGARIGVGHVATSGYTKDDLTAKLTLKATNQALPGQVTGKEETSDSRTIKRIGFGFIGGIGYDITPNITLDLGYRYNDWGRLENVRFKTHEASFGVRYRF